MPIRLRSFQNQRVSNACIPSQENPALAFPRAHKFEAQLQKGSQGNVEQWTHIATKTVIAVKMIRSREKVPNEVDILRKIPEHSSIIGFLAFYDKTPSPEKGSILLEHCPHGDLFMLRSLSIEKGRLTFSETFMWSVYTQLASALAFLHEGIDDQHPDGRPAWPTVVHRDIKLENILVKSLGTKPDWSDLVLKLGDFGMAGYYDPENPNPDGYIATPHYWPPEVKWETKHLTPAGDIWGIAAVIHDLAHTFGPLVTPAVTQARYFSSHEEAPYPDEWPESVVKGYWASQAPRRVVPINLEIDAAVPSLSDPEFGYDKRAITLRSSRPSPRYSDPLNTCMMAALAMTMEERPEAEELLQMIEIGYSDFLFQDLSLHHELESLPEEERSDDEASQPRT